jgi:hypothetical protein
MQEVGLAAVLAWLGALMHVDRLSSTAVLLIGVVVGLIAKNVYTITMRSFGFAGSYVSRLAIGWWEEFRREAPNVVDFALAVVAEYDGRAALHMDPLLAPRRLTDVYLNPRTAFGIRMQTFSVTPEAPWVTFHVDEQPGRIERIQRWLWHSLRGRAVPDISPRDRLILKYRRVYAPIETLIGQFLTNQWAVQMAIGEPCHVFRFVVALVYEKATGPHVDRHFHALVIWEEMLRREDLTDMVTFLPEYRHRLDTILRIGARYRSSPDAARTFGVLNVMIPKRILQHVYFIGWMANIDGEMVPISRPVAQDGVLALDVDTGLHVLHSEPADLINPLD